MIFSAKTFIPNENGELLAASDSLQEEIFQNTNTLPPGDYGAAFVKMFLTLLVLIALFGISIWFIKRLIRSRLERGTGSRMIQILEKKMISPKTMLYVVEVDGKKILMAESHLEVRPISSIAKLEHDHPDENSSEE